MINVKSKKLPVSCLILGGGRGVRMGGNKLFLALNGVPVIETLVEKFSHIFDEILICVAKGEKNFCKQTLRLGSISFCEDKHEGLGPLDGLISGLGAMKNEWGFLWGCDMSEPNEEVIRQMAANLDGERDVVCARVDGHLSAICAFYRKNCLPHAQKKLATGELKIKSFYREVNVKIIEGESLPPGFKNSFRGVNTREEL